MKIRESMDCPKCLIPGYVESYDDDLDVYLYQCVECRIQWAYVDEDEVWK